MKLAASMIVRNEMSRFLTLTVPALEEFCDVVVVVDDASTDGSYEWLAEREKVKVVQNTEPLFVENEGLARQGLFEFTLDQEPTHVLAIDADEFVSDGKLLRARIKELPEVPVWSLLVTEIWEADEKAMYLRADGGWAPHYSPVCYRLPDGGIGDDLAWQVPARKLASGREPHAVVQSFLNGDQVAVAEQLLHFGWARPLERYARYRRYAENNDGEYHSTLHLQSIMWAEDRIVLEGLQWPWRAEMKQQVLGALS